MNLGICSWAFSGILRGQRTILDLSQKASRAGFNLLEAPYISRSSLSETWDHFGYLPARISSLATLELHRFHLTDLVAARRDRAVQVVREMAERASQFGIPSISFSPGKLWPGQTVDQSLDNLASLLGPIVESAGSRSVTVCLENLSGHILQCRTNMEQLLSRLPAARVCLDLGNALLDPPVTSWFQTFRSRLGKIHLSDGRVVNGNLEIVPLGHGDLDWTAIHAELLQLPDGVDLFVEALLDEGEAEDQFLDSCHRQAGEVLEGLATI